MAARAIELSPAPPDDVLAAVFGAVERAPLMPLTDEESALLADVEGRPVKWISHEEFASRLPGLLTKLA